MSLSSRRDFIASAALAAGAFSLSGCETLCPSPIKGRVALQLYSVRKYIKAVGLAKALKDVKAIGYGGVEFAGYYDYDAKTLKAMLGDAGLVACGTHIGNELFQPDKIKAACEFELAYGNHYLCCPGGGNYPKSMKGWNDGSGVAPQEALDHTKRLCDLYNQAAATAKTYGCIIGLHNHMWEFGLKMPDGTSFWDYFFSHTDSAVQMEQDVGWTTCAGLDPCAQYAKYPHRSFTLHAKENGMGKGVKKFDAILGKPGEPGAKGVEWDRLLTVAEADGVKWWVVECEKHENDLSAVTPSYEFLKSKGLN